MTVDELLGSDTVERDRKIMGKKNSKGKSVPASKVFGKKSTGAAKLPPPHFVGLADKVSGLVSIIDATRDPYKDGSYIDSESFTKDGAERRLQAIYAEAYALEDALDILAGG